VSHLHVEERISDEVAGYLAFVAGSGAELTSSMVELEENSNGHNQENKYKGVHALIIII